MPDARRKPEWTIPLIYFIVSASWIFLSDLLLFDFLAHMVSVQMLSALKGILFVLVTAVMLHVLLRRTFTGYRQRHREREEVLARLHLHIDRMPIGYIVTDRDFRFTYLNPAAERMFGFRLDEVKGKSPYGLIIPASSMSYVEDVRKSWLEGNPEPHGRNPNLRKDGSTIICDWFNTPIYSEDGSFDHLISMVQDVTELEEAIEALRQSEERYRLLTDDLPALVCEFLPDSTLTYVNTAYADYFGTVPDQLVGRRFTDFLQPDVAERVRETYMALTPNRPAHTYSHAVLIEGREVTHQWTDRAFFDDRGRITRLQGVGFDLTDRIEMEKTLKRKEEQYRLLVENQTDLLVKVDREGRFQFVSPSYCRLFGKTEEELLGKSFVPLVHEDDRSRTMEAMEALYRPPWTTKIEQRAMTRDGWRWLEWVDTAVLDDRGSVASILGVGRDITARKTAEAALRESEERYRILIERANDGILLLHNGVFITCNQSAASMLRMGAAQIIGRRPADLSPPTQPDGMSSAEKADQLMRQSEQGGHHVFEWIHLRSDGEEAIIEVSLSPVELGGEPMLLCFWRDVTVRRQTEQEIVESRHRLRALAERLDEVREEERLHLSREIHDGLGQSLTALKIDLSFLRRLLEPRLDSQAPEAVEELEEALASMDSLLRQTIDQVREIAWEMRPGMLHQLGLPDALRQYIRDIAERSGLQLIEEIDDLDPLPQARTALALFRIVQEAVTNTVRHAAARTLRLRLRRKDGAIQLEIADDGRGIHLADVRTAASPPGSGSGGGPSGIGLNSMRERAELLGGGFSVGSPAKGSGTVVSVIVPETPDGE